MKHVFKTEKEWLAARRKVITATEAASLFGLNPYASVNKMLKNKVDPEDLSGNPFIWAGHIYEPGIVMKANKLMPEHQFKQIGGEGQDIEFYIHPEARLGASPDALSEDGTILLEAKSASERLFESWEDGVPLHYEVQVRVQMACMGLKKAYIACVPRNAGFKKILKEVFESRIKKVAIEKMWENVLTLSHDFDRMKILEVKHCPRREALILAETNRLWQCIDDDEEFKVDKDAKEAMR